MVEDAIIWLFDFSASWMMPFLVDIHKLLKAITLLLGKVFYVDNHIIHVNGKSCKSMMDDFWYNPSVHRTCELGTLKSSM